MRKHSLLFIGALPPPYHGVTVFNYNLLNSELGDHYDIIHLDTSDKRSLDNLGKMEPVNIVLGIENLFQLIVLCLRKNPDLIYLPISENKAYLRDGLFILFAKLFSSRKKVIAHAHGSYFRNYYNQTNWFMKRFIDFTIRKVDTIIVLGNRLIYIYEGWVKNIEVVPNGVCLNPDLRGEFKQKRNDLIISFLGIISKNKGILDVITAMKIVIEKYPNIQCKLAGEWLKQKSNTKEVVFRFIKENYLEDKIDFVGRVLDKEKEQFLVHSDIFVFPSHVEAQGIVNIEAMACGCPVISTKVGTIPEVVIDGKTGILVEKKNPKAVAQAIIKLIEDPELRVKMGMAGRKRYEQYYTQEKNIENMIKVFEHTLKRENA